MELREETGENIIARLTVEQFTKFTKLMTFFKSSAFKCPKNELFLANEVFFIDLKILNKSLC